ncbi:MAG: hypothetical protein NZ898_05295 [Myxococcota bacterium]|nr:hypothetical protein [Myxococcota bacterium]MDW8362104.1 hypothetical protein [Myxococcales bacterium]
MSGLLCGALLVGTDLSRQMVAVVWLLPTYVVLGAVLALAIDTLDGGAGRIGPALRAGIGSVLGLVVAGLFSQLAILIFLLLLVIPGVLRYLSYLLVYPLVVSGESGGFDALRLSAERMRGRRAAAGGAVLLTGWPMLLAMGIDWVVYGDPLVSLLGTEGAPAPAWLEVLLTAMAGFFPLPLTMLTAVLYHRTAPAGA